MSFAFKTSSKELYMKKKIVLVALVVVLVIVPAFAAPKQASSVSIGAQVGYPTGVAVAADFDFNQDWYLVTDAGLWISSGNSLGIAADALVNWTFATADGFRRGDKWEFAAGAGVGAGILVGNQFGLTLRPEGDVRVTYAFTEGWDVFFRLDLGYDMRVVRPEGTEFGGFGFNAALGCTYAL